MVIGIISIVIGAIVCLVGFSVSANSAIQETVQQLIFINGTIFIVGGFILLQLNKNFNKFSIISYDIDMINKNFENFVKNNYDTDNKEDENSKTSST